MENLKFTETEQKYISDTFRRTLIHFADKPLNRDNPNDLRAALVYREKYIGNIGIKGHKTTQGIYDKLGFCKDGQTTKAEAAKQIVVQKATLKADYTNEKRKMIAELNKRILDLENLKAEISSEEEKVERESEKIHSGMLDEEKARIQNAKDLIRQTLLEKQQNKLQSFTVKQLRDLARDKGLSNFSSARKKELVDLIMKSEE